MVLTRVSAGLLLATSLASPAQFGWLRHEKKTAETRRTQKRKPAEGVQGLVVKTTPASCVVRAIDSRVITFKTTDETLYFRGSRWASPGQVVRGSSVMVNSTADVDGNLTATEIILQDKRPEPLPQAQAIDLLPGGVADDPLVERARQATEEFFKMLPNFVCQQSTTRSYAGADGHWRTVDRVTAEVLYDHGHESYRDVKLNGKATGRSIMELPGSRSTGEFGSTLRALFDPDTEALFKFEENAPLGAFETSVYEFAVSGEQSDWRITAGSQMIMTAYAGKIWIDRNSGNVVRIEMRAVSIPQAFPFRRVEAEVDYGPVMLASGRYFLPATAQNVSCNDPKSCSRNLIEFRNYHKYIGQTSITFGGTEDGLPDLTPTIESAPPGTAAAGQTPETPNHKDPR